MNKYGKAAIEALNLIKLQHCDSPEEAWRKATEKIFGEGTSSQKKGCPRGAFLGLCEEGLVKGIKPGNYCNSKENKKYAVNAIELLKHDGELVYNKKTLWLKSVGFTKTHNSQMDVVTALWKDGLINV